MSAYLFTKIPMASAKASVLQPPEFKCPMPSYSRLQKFVAWATMLPSRGFRSVNRLHRLSKAPGSFSRQFSGGPSLHSPCRVPFPHGIASSRSRIPVHKSTRLSIASAAPATVRFQSSTVSSASPAAGVIAPSTNTSTTSLSEYTSSSLEGISDTTIKLSTAFQDGQIGYLKSLGFDYGWGVTSSIQWILEHIHVYGGLPWWGAIIATTLGIRVALIHFSIKSSDSTAKMTALKPVLKPIEQKQRMAAQTGDKHAIMEARTEFMNVLKSGGVSMTSIWMPMLWQTVIGIASFRLLRAMAALPVPELETGGFLWLQDLTLADPYYALPISMSLLLHFLMRYGGEVGAQALDSKLRNVMVYGMPAISLAATSWLPGALQLSFATATLWGVGQGYILRQSAVRDWLKLAPIIRPGTEVSASSPIKTSMLNMAPTYQAPDLTPETTPSEPEAKGIFAGAKKEFKGMVNEVKDKATQWTGQPVSSDEQSSAKLKSKSFLKQAAEYERRKSAEIEEDRRHKNNSEYSRSRRRSQRRE